MEQRELELETGMKEDRGGVTWGSSRIISVEANNNNNNNS